MIGDDVDLDSQRVSLSRPVSPQPRLNRFRERYSPRSSSIPAERSRTRSSCNPNVISSNNDPRSSALPLCQFCVDPSALKTNFSAIPAHVALSWNSEEVAAGPQSHCSRASSIEFCVAYVALHLSYRPRSLWIKFKQRQLRQRHQLCPFYNSQNRSQRTAPFNVIWYFVNSMTDDRERLYCTRGNGRVRGDIYPRA